MTRANGHDPLGRRADRDVIEHANIHLVLDQYELAASSLMPPATSFE